MQSGRQNGRGSWSRGILATLLIAALSVVAAEFTARRFFDLQPLEYGRVYSPLFVSGDSYYLTPNEQLPFTPGGPVELGYREKGFGFHYDLDAKAPHTSTTFGDFLFSHTRSRYGAAEIDRISCAEPDALTIYVVGGSVAQGFSAERKEDTWHARLEALLRDRLDRKDLYVFNAAMGAFVSLQEKLAFYLAVVPRRANLVLIVDGYNDITIPPNSAVRAGDPYQVGLRFSQLFTDGFMWWLARHSAIANKILQNEFKDDVVRYRTRLENDDAFFNKQAEAIADIYVENTGEMLATCIGRGQACFVGIQPARSLTAEYLGTQVDDILPQKRVVEAYRLLLAKVAASPLRDRYVDLTHVFDKGEKLNLYADSVHPNFAGSEVLARALLPHALAALKNAPPVPAVSNRCERLR